MLWKDAVKSVTLASLATDTLIPNSQEMSINFACFGRQKHGNTSNEGPPYFGRSTVPMQHPGPTASDWSWKPDGHPGARVRQPAPGYKKVSIMRTFRGVPPSAAELYRHVHRQP